MKAVRMFAVAAPFVVAFMGPAMAASTCAEQIQSAKAAVADTGTNKKDEESKRVAVVKIREAEEALSKKNEAACLGAIEAANASIK